MYLAELMYKRTLLSTMRVVLLHTNLQEVLEHAGPAVRVVLRRLHLLHAVERVLAPWVLLQQKMEGFCNTIDAGIPMLQHRLSNTLQRLLVAYTQQHTQQHIHTSGRKPGSWAYNTATKRTLPKLSLLMWCDMSKFLVGKGTRSCTCMLPCWNDLPGAKWKLPATCRVKNLFKPQGHQVVHVQWRGGSALLPS